MKKTMAVACALFLAGLCLSSVLPVHGEGEVYEKTLRLHVLANSDSEEDQALKLAVRDAVLAEVTPLLEGCESRSEAETLVGDHLDAIAAAAEAVVSEWGYGYGVSASVGLEAYPERSYGSFRLPAGEYCSLTVRIGEAAGQNWWCVLFPPLCTGAAEVREELAAVGFTPAQIRLLTDAEHPQYVLRFKILEWLESVF